MRALAPKSAAHRRACIVAFLLPALGFVALLAAFVVRYPNWGLSLRVIGRLAAVPALTALGPAVAWMPIEAPQRWILAGAGALVAIYVVLARTRAGTLPRSTIVTAACVWFGAGFCAFVWVGQGV